MGAEPAVLGIDVGQTGARAEVIASSGRVLGSGEVPVQVAAAAGRAEQDVAAWIAAVDAASRSAIAASRCCELAGICAGALGPAPVLLDDDLRPLAPAILYRLDNRSEPQRRQLEKLTGRPVSADHAVPRLHWWRENHPELWNRTRTVVDVTGALVCALTGRAVLDSVSGREYYDLDDTPADGDLRLAGRCEPTSVAGALSPAAADRLGVAPGAPVLAGSIDSFLDLFAAGVRRPGDGGIVAGSTAVVALAANAEVRPQARAADLEVSAYLGPGWLVLDWTGAAGSALAWIGRLLGGRQELDRLAASLPPGAGGLVALAGLAPGRDGTSLGTISGLSLATGRAEMYRAIVDAVAIEIAGIARRCARAAGDPAIWHAWGGAFRSAALTQAVADSLGSPVAFSAGSGRVAAAEVARQIVLGGSPVQRWRAVEPDPVSSARMRCLAAESAALAECLANWSADAPGMRAGRAST
ncbi:MAG TPA: FGGY family carbohydrate kinase [Streptosporangiaceae bacterium]